MPDSSKKPPLQAERDSATGIGGLARRRKIDTLIDEAVAGRQLSKSEITRKRAQQTRE